MKMRKHRIKGVEFMWGRSTWVPGQGFTRTVSRVITGNGYHRKTFDSEVY